MALTLPIGLTDGGVRVASTVSGVESCRAQASESTVLLITLSVADSGSVGISDASPAVVDSVSVADSLKAGLSESTPVVIDPNIASFSVSESVRVSALDTVATATVFSSVADTGPAVQDAITDLNVFTGNSSEQFSVSDTLIVRLNGIEPPAPTIPLTVTDSLRVGFTDTVSTIPVISLNVVDSLRVTCSDAGRTPSVAITTVDSHTIGLLEPDDQLAHFGVIESLGIGESESSPVIVGDFIFTVTDSCAVRASEGLPSFGQVSVGAVESIRVQTSEVLATSKSLAVVDSCAVRASDVGSTVRSIALADACAVQLTDLATSIFNDFVALNASDSCRVALSETVTELISYLIQLQVSDTCAVASAEASLFGGSSISCDDLALLTIETQTDALVTGFVLDTLRMGTAEAGLAIPIIPVSITTFTDDTCLIGCDEHTAIQYNLGVEDGVLVGAEEDNITRFATAGTSPDTWNGSIEIEHRNEQPHPGRFRFSMKMGW